jgi:DNA-directed RNA polymerase specialized sigma24 family protein
MGAGKGSTLEALSEAQAVRKLIHRCLAGDGEAARSFQEAYGELIYGYPIRVYRTPADEAGDFYVFAFQDGRIFRRLRTFEGRAPFRAYLLGFVLDDLVLEWKRAERRIDTVSIEDIGELPNREQTEVEVMTAGNGTGRHQQNIDQLLGTLEPSKTVVFKLLHAEDCELTPDELRYLATVSGRPLPDVIAAVERLRATIRDREAALRGIEDNLDSVQAWIQLYQRRLRRIAEDLNSVQAGSKAADKLRAERAELERKIERRGRQRDKLLGQAKRRKVTAPYKDIAVVLNTTVGNVGSQIARLREELSQVAGESFGEFIGRGTTHESH